uniref:Uncharacterized protein n=1 Tax=Anabas testudineus TaxID=64144 RepID=A0A7N6B4W1_ANATE
MSSDTADHVASEEMEHVPETDTSSPPPTPNSNVEQEPPPYSEEPSMYPSPKPSMCEPATGYEPSPDIDPEAVPQTIAIIASSPFDDKTVRRGFIRKVFSILTLQLLFTFSVVCVFTFSSVVKKAIVDNIWAYISSFIIFIVVATTLSFCKSLSRRHPWNIVALVVVTISLSYMVGTIASFHETSSVIITMGATLAISLAIIIYSAQVRQ